MNNRGERVAFTIDYNGVESVKIAGHAGVLGVGPLHFGCHSF
jgi:hypothetical protein